MATEIKYNGSVIASPEAGQTATLKCAGMTMESDVVVDVAEQSGDGTDTSATATVNDIRDGETAWVNGVKITGEVPTREASNISIDTTSSTSKVYAKADAGIYDSDVEKAVMDKVSIPAPDISVNNDTGEITAAVYSSASGYYEGDGSSNIKQLDTRAGTSALPEKVTKTLINKGEFATGDIEVLGDSNFEPYNIKAGVELWGITGTYDNTLPEGIVTKSGPYTVTPENPNRSEIIRGYVSIEPPSTNSGATYVGVDTQTVAIEEYADMLDGNLQANNIKKDVTIFGIDGTFTEEAEDVAVKDTDILLGKVAYVNGERITGTIPSKEKYTYTPSTQNQRIDAGQYLAGAQDIEGDVRLHESNIRAGASIFGVEGNFTADATASSSDIRSGKTAYVNGSRITGNATFVDASGFSSINITVGENYTFFLPGKFVTYTLSSSSYVDFFSTESSSGRDGEALLLGKSAGSCVLAVLCYTSSGTWEMALYTVHVTE